MEMVGLLNGSLYEALENPTVEQGSSPANITDAPGPTGNPAEVEELGSMTVRFSSLASDGGILFDCCPSLRPGAQFLINLHVHVATTSEFSHHLHHNIYKNHSRWRAAADLNYSLQDQTLLGSDLWSIILANIADSDGLNEYLMTFLGLDPSADPSVNPQILKLHDIENALSNLAAMLFWIGGHMRPDPWYTAYSGYRERQGTVPVLLSGKTIVQQNILRLRLSATVGLLTSVALTLLSILFVLSAKGEDVIESTGLLHIIWLYYRLGPNSFLRGIKAPTKIRLRVTSLIPVQLSSKDIAPWGIHNEKTSDTWSDPIHDHGAWSTLLPTSIALHGFLVVLFVALLGLGILRTEHSVIFSLEHQKSVSFWCTIVATAFGTIYHTLLVYMARKSAMTKAVQRYSILAATHDELSAWTGIGAAFSTLAKQLTLPTAALGIFSIMVDTTSIPIWSDSPQDTTLALFQAGGAFLPWLSQLDESNKLGLENGSLYDVLTKAYPGSGTTRVSALGFNITCSHIPNVTVNKFNPSLDGYNISFPANISWPFLPDFPGPNVILIHRFSPTIQLDSIVLYTENPIFDSYGTRQPSVTIPNSNVGVVDSSTKLIVPGSLLPILQKENSTWPSYTFPQNDNSSSLVEGDSWANFLPGMVSDAGFLATPGGFGIDGGSVYVKLNNAHGPDYLNLFLPDISCSN
ncbi:hypothetical protein B0H14DRAFT_2652463 [Mycena olivaceomarginata]|nr:hypothetical protein B0H14DRAFT_2652463 [Mycena olivaceomarginata]